MGFDGAATPGTDSHAVAITAVLVVIALWFLVHGWLWYRGWIKRKRKGGFKRMKSQGQRSRERQDRSHRSRRR